MVTVGRFSQKTSSPKEEEKKKEAVNKYVPPTLREGNSGGDSTFRFSSEQQATGSLTSKYIPPSRRPGFIQSAFKEKPSIEYKSPWTEKDWFPRNEYIEKMLFKRVHEGGINFEKYDDIPVKIEPTRYPPLKTFFGTGLHPLVEQNISLLGYKVPTPIQKYTIPALVKGQDIMACAQTGSGKTAAFLAPLVSQILTKYGPPKKNPEKTFRPMVFPFAVVLTPTRELCIQIFEEAEKFAYRTWLGICAVYGGASQGEQLKKLKEGCEILIATPGRLTDFAERGYVRLTNVQYFVLDEGDRMLDMGFEPQIRRIITSFGMPKKEERQTLLFSATFPQAIQRQARDFLRKHVFITVGKLGSTTENITQELVYVSEYEKPIAILEFLNDKEIKGARVLVFTEKKIDAKDLESYLHSNHISAVSIHGDKEQHERDKALKHFKEGRADVLVATSVAARGLDIPKIALVINFDLPGTIEEYVHRIGRTGRAGHSGKAISFFNEKNIPLTRDLIALLEETNQEIPSWLDEFSSRNSQRKEGFTRFR